jgi:ATP-dependent Lhr-like helicase
VSKFSTLPPGPNVGTQLAALRRARARRRAALTDEGAAEAGTAAADAQSAGSAPAARTSRNSRKSGALAGVLPKSPVTASQAEDWFAAQGWQPFAFQRQVWAHMREGRSGLLHATTGAGKTLAAWFGALAVCRAEPAPAGCNGPQVLWITPMRALAADTTRALQVAADGIGMGWTVEQRTGDTASATKARQRKTWPPALVTTPESLSLMLAMADSAAVLGAVQVLIVDEWHELLGNKRGTQLLLALARLRRLSPRLRVWGLSATLGNLEEACAALTWEGMPAGAAGVGDPAAPGTRASALSHGIIVRGAVPKALTVDSLIPQTMERFPWGGHLGLRLLPEVVAELEGSVSSLVFTNTRSQAELWYQALLEARPDWAGLIALHHGSLDPSVRQWVEAGLKAGQLKAVVCTSSLDLGVDFLPVERVLQIGSPKGVARLLQRAGRSGHAPGRPSRITVVPSQALELLEAAAARRAAAAGRIERREPPPWPLDVLVQHLLTLAVGPGFEPHALYEEVKTAWTYRDLDRESFDWCLGFTVHGGTSLAAYPEHHRIVRDEAGICRVANAAVARRHRMSIGTIVSDAAMSVQWLNGGRIGSVEESFIASLREGDCFIFSGRVLQLVRVRDLTAFVTKAPGQQGAVPVWQGGKMPLSSELADTALSLLDEADALLDRPDPGREHASPVAAPVASRLAQHPDPELRALTPLLALQAEVSALPCTARSVFEMIETDEGHHLFCYPLAGRMVHIGLGALLAWRAARHQTGTFSLSMNDYGFELLSRKPFDWPRLLEPAGPGSWAQGLLSLDNLVPDIQQALNATELSLRRFREIARVAGLVFTGYPGAGRSARQVQASAKLFFDVFRRHDPGNLLLAQAEAETLAQELDVERLQRCLARMGTSGSLTFTRPQRLTPFAFPLMVERLRERVTTEQLHQRVLRLLAEMEAALQPSPSAAAKPARRRGSARVRPVAP